MAARKKASAAWVQFPYTSREYEYGTGSLERRWRRLHAGDAEPWPDAKRVGAYLPAIRAGAGAGDARLAPDAAAARVQAAWRAFHAGDFRTAWRDGARLGPPGAVAAVKAAAVYASYVEPDEARSRQLLLECMALAERAVRAAPGYANLNYVHAVALGRHAQRIPVLEALAADFAGRMRASLERVLELAPAHADAYLALGVYHAEIVAKAGVLGARLTFGASATAAEENFERALEINPDAPVGPLEYALALRAMHHNKARGNVLALLRRAAAVRPADAMERLDVERARRELGRLG